MSIGDPRFFVSSGPHRLAAVAEAAGGTAPEIDLLLTGVAPLQAAGPDEVSFLDNRRYAAALEATSAGAVIVHPDMIARVPPGVVSIVTPNPYEGGLGWLACSTRRLRVLLAYIPRHSSMNGRRSTRRPRSGRSPLWQQGLRSAPAAGSVLTPPSAKAS